MRKDQRYVSPLSDQILGLAKNRAKRPQLSQRVRLRLEELEGRLTPTCISFGPPLHTFTGIDPVSMVAADFDNDGRVDLAVAGFITGTNERVVTVLQNTSSCAPGPFAGTGKVIVTGNAVLAADWTSQLPPRFPAEPVLNSLPRQWLFEPPLDRGLTVQDPLEPALLSGTAATAPRPRPPLEPGFADLDGSMLVDAVPKDLPLARLGAAGAPLDHDSTTP